LDRSTAAFKVRFADSPSRSVGDAMGPCSTRTVKGNRMRLDRTATAAVRGAQPFVRALREVSSARSASRAPQVPPSTAVNDFALVSNDSAIGGVARVRLLSVKEPPQGA
jgi:hypothetical protein